jgi:hypothetical protein
MALDSTRDRRAALMFTVANRLPWTRRFPPPEDGVISRKDLWHLGCVYPVGVPNLGEPGILYVLREVIGFPGIDSESVDKHYFSSEILSVSNFSSEEVL